MPSLNESAIARLVNNQRPERSSKFFSDDSRDAPKGFMLRVQASGAATFVLVPRRARQ